jgi:hypothetical protein
MPRTHRELVQFDGTGVEILHGLARKVQARSSDLRIPSATLALALDANSTAFKAIFSENKHSTVCKNLSIRFCSASVIKGSPRAD